MDNTLGCYSTKNNTSIQLSSDKCGSFIVNGEYILYKNLDDLVEKTEKMKVSYLNTIVKSICLHKVGNKIADEGIKFSKKELVVPEDLENTLLKYFVSSF